MAGQGSARVTLNEIDLSQVRNPQITPQGVPAAVVGPASKGPAFVPRTFANMQQFEEVFGSMRERGFKSNSNNFGPLALNEWLRSAQAGTYLRILGVGDGKESIGGKVTDAGFIVGERQVQEQELTAGKVGDNPHANITNTDAALELGRTHFLGCFMTDAPGSKYLKESGVQVEDAKASIQINFTAVPQDDSIITLISSDGTTKTYGFKDGGGAVGADVSVNTDTLTDVQTATALKVLIEGATGHNGKLTVADDGAGNLTITQATAGISGNTNIDAKINAASRDTINIVGNKTISNSTLDDTFQFREGTDGTPARITITAINDAAIADGNTFVFQQVDNDGTTTNKTFTVDSLADVKTAAADAADAADAAEAAGYFWTGADDASFVLVDSQAANIDNNFETLKNLAAAINGDLGTGSTTLSAVINEVDKSITVTQALQSAVEGNAATLTGSVKENSIIINGAQHAPGNDTVNTTFTGGVNAENASVTLFFEKLPNLGDTLSLPDLNSNAGGVAEDFVIVAENAGADNAKVDAGSIKVELGASIDIFLANLKEALLNNNGGAIDSGDLTADIDVVNNTIKIQTKALGLVENKKLTLNMSDAVTVTNPQGEILQGNFGLKTTSFAGGESNVASPVIRGVLMSPQGVRPALDVPDALTDLLSTADTDDDESSIRETAHGKSFGGSNGDLVGYVVGEVNPATQGFRLILNGFSNPNEPHVLNCSFDPASSTYFAKVLNTDPVKMEECGHCLYTWWDIEGNVATVSNTGLTRLGAQIAGDYENMTGFLVAGSGGRDAGVLNYENFRSRFQTAKTPWIVSQSFDSEFKLFRLHALDDGEISNGQYRLLISGLRYNGGSKAGRFDLAIERLKSDPIKGSKIIEWKNLSLDADDNNFVGRVIGDQHVYFDFDLPEGKQRIKSTGTYAVRNPHVRIELSDDLLNGNVPIDALPAGFLSHAYLKTASAGNFVEQDLAVDNLIFNNAAGNAAQDILSTAQVAPVKFVKSTSRFVTSTIKESSSDLAWGVKLAKKEYSDSSLSENIELFFDDSVINYSKYFPTFSGVMIEDDGSSSEFQNGRFSLERIQIPRASLVGGVDVGDISTWDGAEYRRDGVLNTAVNGRFVNISRDATGTNIYNLKFRCLFQGGFDGVNIFDKEKANFTGTASLREGFDETSEKKYSGPTVMAYRRACDVLTDKSSAEFQVLALPGQRAAVITDYAMNACEDRFDALYLMDLVEYDAQGYEIEDDLINPHVRNTIAQFKARNLNSSFAAAYFPNVLGRRLSDNAAIMVPPSVMMLGVLARNDAIAAPWFAPAGLNRGRLGATSVSVQMNRDLLDELYDTDINPIYEPAGRAGEVYVFGQKTLLQDESALDRINVRRLLIDIRRKVKKIGESLLFEPNRESTLARFSSLVEPIMADVQRRQGVVRYKVQIDSSTTTQNDIENNTIRGKIYLQPTKSVEFISLDFVVANTIQQ